ncbi:MAG TPA: cytochrome c biogenesis protein CcdA [Candidatus Omnitrophota bacterium]|nr:cytochrome c biogenesis protein CcdA [Candidatus Omnitrophota bacterium]HRZ15478.1 cytochrome c biogenesis protein CcdA [Candidatus Omnitrophota bacterium]
MHLSGNPLDYLIVFLGGITLSFTPCVYPLIPVTTGYIGLNAGGSKLKAFSLSFVYVSGIAVTYAALGLLASLTGKLFGRISAHPATLIVVGAVFVLFGLSMLDVFAVYFPAVSRLEKIKGHGYHSIFLLGLFSGLIASPCVAPALGAILVFIATTRNVVYGTSLLLVFGYGMGLLLILAGTFSTVLLHLPRSGKWMVYVERVCAAVLMGTGAFFIITGIGRL